MILRFVAVFIVLLDFNVVYGQDDIRNCLTGFRPTASVNLQHLKQWGGKYSFDKDSRSGKTFFQLPEIRKPLQNLLNKSDLRLLTKTYGTESPIEVNDNYLLLHRCKPHYCPDENVLLVVNLENGSMNVAFFRMYGSKTETRWIDGNIDHYHLPEKIIASVYSGHTPLLGFIPEFKMLLKDYINESNYCIKNADYSKAFEFIKEGIKYYPDSARLYGIKGYILIKMNRDEEASECMKEMLKRVPDY